MEAAFESLSLTDFEYPFFNRFLFRLNSVHNEFLENGFAN